jgi:hypothetical protein
MAARRTLRKYDHRLVRLVQETRDPTIATRLDVPRSTVAGWLRRAPTPVPVLTSPSAEAEAAQLRVRLARLQGQLRRARAMLRILFALFRILQPDLSRLRIPNGADKARLLRAIDRSRSVLGLRRIFRMIGLSPSRLAAWKRTACLP